MTEYLFTVIYRAVNGWSEGTMTVSEVAESLDDAVLKMRMSFEKSGYTVESYRVYGFIKAVEEDEKMATYDCEQARRMLGVGDGSRASE